MDEILKKSKQEILDEIAQAWAEIDQFLDSLTEAQWTQVKNPDGWAVKDYVAHITAWENSVIFALNKKPVYEGLGITLEVLKTRDYDLINDAIFKNHQNDPLEDVRAEFQRIHADFVKAIEALSEDDLNLPYGHFQPDRLKADEGPPIVLSIYNDGAPHYRDHRQWMKEQLGLQS